LELASRCHLICHRFTIQAGWVWSKIIKALGSIGYDPNTLVSVQELMTPLDNWGGEDIIKFSPNRAGLLQDLIGLSSLRAVEAWLEIQ